MRTTCPTHRILLDFIARILDIDSRKGQGFFSSPSRPDRLGCTFGLLPKEYRG